MALGPWGFWPGIDTLEGEDLWVPVVLGTFSLGGRPRAHEAEILGAGMVCGCRGLGVKVAATTRVLIRSKASVWQRYGLGDWTRTRKEF